MNPADESKKIPIDNAVKPNGQQGQEPAKAPEQQQQPQYQQYQQQYYPQQPYPNANYGYGANPAAYPYNYQMQQQQQQQQYQQYYQQYYGQQQQHPQYQMQQQQAYYQQYGQQYAPGYQGYYAQQAKAYGRPPVSYQGQPPLTQVNNKIQVPDKPEATKPTNDPNYDPLLEEIKWTVLNEQRIQKKSKWSAEVVVPEDIHEYFEKKPEKKRSEYNIRNLFDEEGQAAFEIYVRKCFDKCENAKEQQLMSSLLLTVITELLQNKTIEKVSWKSYPLPILPRENEKPTALPVSALALAAANSNPLNSFTPFHIPGFNLNNAAYLVDPATANTAQNTTTSAAGSSAPGGTLTASSASAPSAITQTSQIQQSQQITINMV